MQGGFCMEELIAAAVTTIDIFVVYVFLQVRRRKMLFVFWTAFLNCLLPFLGFMLGELSTVLFADWSILLSGILLSLIGLHMLLQEDDDHSKMLTVPPALIALIVSIDAFSVSVTLGMLQLNRLLFILASGIFSFVFALVALYFQKKLRITSGKRVRQFAGLSLFVIGVLSSFH